MDLLPSSRPGLAVYLINLANAQERLHAMLARLAALGLSAQRVEGVNGASLSLPIPQFSALCYKVMHGRRACPPEIGCYLSHIACAQKLLDSDDEYALILEDDILFHADFVEAIDAALLQSQHWDILRLTTVNDGPLFRFSRLTRNRALAISLTREKGAGAYIINRKAATWIATKLVPMRLAYDIAFDLEFFHGLKAAFIAPVCATQDADDATQIQDNIRDFRLPAWRYLTVMPYRAYLEVVRFACRGYRLVSAQTRRLAPRPQQSAAPAPSVIVDRSRLN